MGQMDWDRRESRKPGCARGFASTDPLLSSYVRGFGQVRLRETHGYDERRGVGAKNPTNRRPGATGFLFGFTDDRTTTSASILSQSLEAYPSNGQTHACG